MVLRSMFCHLLWYRNWHFAALFRACKVTGGTVRQWFSSEAKLNRFSINTEKGTHLEKEKKPERSLPARLEKRLPLWDLPGQTVRTILWRSAQLGQFGGRHSEDAPERGGCTLFVKYTYFTKRIVQVSHCLLYEVASCFKGTCIWLLWLCYILYDISNV